MELNFQNWHYGQSDSFPDDSGIYCVFSKVEGELIYIGQAENIKERIANHERWPDFLERKDPDSEYLATTYALLPIGDLDKAEGRLIAKNPTHENEKIPLAYYKGSMDLIGLYVWGLKA